LLFDSDSSILIDGAMFHLDKAASLYEDEGRYELTVNMQRHQTMFLESRGETDQAEKYRKLVESNVWLYELESEELGEADMQDTKGFEPITDEQLIRYDQEKLKDSQKKSRVRKLANTFMSKLVKPRY
jgi:hypothetical protein